MLHFETVSPCALDLLIQISGDPRLREFALAGGTSLALRFGHRLSVDLDFFTPGDFDKSKVESALSTGRSFKLEQKNPVGLSATVEGVKVDMVTYRYPLLCEPEVIDEVRLFSLQDVAAMKLSAVTNRGAKKDFYDLAMLIEEVGLAQLMEIYFRKYPQHEPLLMIRSLSYFDDAEGDQDPVSLIGMSWDEVKERISAAVRKML